MTLPIFEGHEVSLNRVQKNAIIDFHELIYHEQIKIKKVDACFCGSPNHQILSRCDRFGLPFGTKICRDCGLISQTLQLHPDSLELFYDRIYWPLITGRADNDMQQDSFVTDPKLDEASSFVLPSVDNSKQNLRLFEVGCGSGVRINRLANELRQQGRTVESFGCDFNSAALHQARAKGINVVQGGFDQLAKMGRADVLIMSHVFEHLPDLRIALKNIRSLINADALIYIEVPGVADLQNKLEYNFNYQLYCVLAHTYNFSLQSLTNVLQSGGFRLVKGDEYVRAIFTVGENGISNNSAYETTIRALERAYSKQQGFDARRNRPIVRYFRSLAKALLGRAPSWP